MEENNNFLPSTLRMVAWEVTRSCNLDCAHCRASSSTGPYPGELSTEEGFRFLDDLAAFSQRVVILTGGEPLLREDIFELAAYGTAKGLRMVMATNATLVDEGMAKKMLAAGIKRVSVSIDGPDQDSHDAFRRVSGAFAGAMAGIAAMKWAGMEFQINTTITRNNLGQLAAIHELALGLGAAAHHIFLLVPTGRGKEMADQSIAPAAYEETLHWFHQMSRECPIQLKATCAPHYFRILHQQKDSSWKKAASPLQAMTRGCMGGSSFCFVSHTGQAQPCGYLELDCGQLKEQSFHDIWHNSKIFNELRNLNLYEGKCGRCEFLKVCGGCRARAYEVSGNYLAEEPYCVYEPRNRKTIPAPAEG